jgi:hypothetical protein
MNSEVPERDYAALEEGAKNNALKALADAADAARAGRYVDASKASDKARSWFLNADVWHHLPKDSGGCR